MIDNGWTTMLIECNCIICFSVHCFFFLMCLVSCVVLDAQCDSVVDWFDLVKINGMNLVQHGENKTYAEFKVILVLKKIGVLVNEILN